MGSITLQVLDVIEYDVSINPTRTILIFMVTLTRDIIYKLCVYDLATSINRRPMSGTATVIVSY